MPTAVETAVQDQPELLDREKHDSSTDSSSLNGKSLNEEPIKEKDDGGYTHQPINTEDLGDVYEDVRAIDLDASGKEKPISMYPLHSPFIINQVADCRPETGEDYAVRLMSLEDDPTLPMWTLRMWFLGLGLSCFAAVLGQLFVYGFI